MSKRGGGSSAGYAMIAAIAAIGFLCAIVGIVAFWVIPIRAGYKYLRGRMRDSQGPNPPRWEGRRLFWLLPLAFAVIFTAVGSGPVRIFEGLGGFLALAMFAYLPFIAIFAPLESMVGFVTARLRWHRAPATRVLFLAACLAIGIAAVTPVERDAAVMSRANTFLNKHDHSSHLINYAPNKPTGDTVSFAASLSDRAMLELPGNAGAAVAGFLNEMMWIEIFAANYALLFNVETVFDMAMSTKEVKRPGVEWGYSRSYYFDHRQVLSFNLAVLGFGGALWALLMLIERWLIFHFHNTSYSPSVWLHAWERFFRPARS